METDGIIPLNRGYAASDGPVQEAGKRSGNGFLYFCCGMVLGGAIIGAVAAKLGGDKIRESRPASVRYMDVDGDSKPDIVIFRRNGLYDVFLQREDGSGIDYRRLDIELSLSDSKAFNEKIKLEEAVENSIKGLMPEEPVGEKQSKQPHGGGGDFW